MACAARADAGELPSEYGACRKAGAGIADRPFGSPASTVMAACQAGCDTAPRLDRFGWAMDFELKIFLDSLPALLDGALLTLQLTLVSVTIGLTLGVLMGLARVSKSPVFRYG